MGLISNHDESAYPLEVEQLADLCKGNNLSVKCGQNKRDHCQLQEGPGCPLPSEHRGICSRQSGGTNLLECTSLKTGILKTNFSLPEAAEEGKTSPPHHPDQVLQGIIVSVLASCITGCLGNCKAPEHKSL